MGKAAVLNRIRALRAQDLSYQDIAHRLNAEGVPTLTGKQTWHRGTIGNMLKRAKEKG